MNKTLPDKYIRNAVYNAVSGLTVSNQAIPIYDYRATGANIPSSYILMTTQSNLVEKTNKCGWFWNSSLLLDIVTIYDLSGNTGSRLMTDDILNAVRDLTYDLQLGEESGLKIVTVNQSFPDDINSPSNNKIVYRKFIRYELLIN